MVLDDDFVSSELLIKTRTFENNIESEVLGGSFVIALVWCELVKTKVKLRPLRELYCEKQPAFQMKIENLERPSK